MKVKYFSKQANLSAIGGQANLSAIGGQTNLSAIGGQTNKQTNIYLLLQFV